MKQFMCSAQERMRNWRDFRKSIQDLNETSQLNETIKWWSSAPFILQPVISWDDPNKWPTPWELLYEGDFCRSSISYLIEQTLVCLGWNIDRFQFWIFKNIDLEEMHIVLVLDRKYLINYLPNEIIDIDEITDRYVILDEWKASF